MRIGLMLLAASVAVLPPAAQAAEHTRLVLQITIDGLRADLLTRYQQHFGNSGFRYLLDEGVVFTNAHYQHANTETIVGHATLATGATPAVHGMVGNVWYNTSTGQLGYNIEDADAPILPTREIQQKGGQVDPAQKRATSSGRSPRGILVPTFSDTLVISTAGDSKNFGISGKDRSAVAMAGQTGIAYWYSTDNGDFVTSQYYMDQYPEWVREWNAERKAQSFDNQQWHLTLEKPENYLHGYQDDRPYEVDLRGYGRVFPHPYGDVDNPLFFTRLLVSPEGDRLLADFGKALIAKENLGADDVPDYLSISFSGVDAVNHFFGPASLENEDVVVALDRTIADLLAFVDTEVGLEHTLIVLSADHGMAEMPEYAEEKGFQAGRLYGDEVLELAREAALTQFSSSDIIKDFFRPYLYLNHELIAEMGLDSGQVADAVAKSLKTVPGIGAAITRHNIMANAGSEGMQNAVRANYHPQRSGDVYIAQAPYWFMFDRGPVAAMHGSPWRYDTHVPLIFVSEGLPPASSDRLVHPADVAPTLSELLAIPQPAAAQGEPLSEVLRQ